MLSYETDSLTGLSQSRLFCGKGRCKTSAYLSNWQLSFLLNILASVLSITNGTR